MKKNILVLALAVLMAFGLASMVGAAGNAKIDVKVTIGEYSQIIVDDGAVLHLTIPKLDQVFESNIVNFTVKSNTSINIGVSTNLLGIDGIPATSILSPQVLVNDDNQLGGYFRVKSGVSNHTLQITGGISGEHAEWWRAQPGEHMVGQVILTISGD